MNKLQNIQDLTTFTESDLNFSQTVSKASNSVEHWHLDDECK